MKNHTQHSDPMQAALENGRIVPHIRILKPIGRSFDVLRNPSFMMFRLEFGDWMGYVWLAMCEYARDHGGIIKGDEDFVARGFAQYSLRRNRGLAAKKILAALPWMEKAGWIAITRAQREGNR